MNERFRILGELGRGGTATVHLAEDTLSGRRIALKVVHPHLAGEEHVRRRLRREVAAAALIRHPAALVPHDLHDLDGRWALSMPWHPGETLAQRVAASGPLEPADVRTVGMRVAGALAAAHRVGVLHRDVTAHNVLLDRPDDAVLTDFGLARLGQGVTRSTAALGTSGYAAPEVYEGVRHDPRSDLYGLGATLYLAVTGRPAFDPGQPMAALKAQLEGQVVPVRTLAPTCPADLAATIEALLRPDPDDRPSGAHEVEELLAGRIPFDARPPRARRDRPTLQLPDGDFTLLVKEREGDRPRRDRLRNPDDPGSSLEQGLEQVGRLLTDRLREAVGWPPPDTRKTSPEERLVNALAEVGGVERLAVPSTVLEKKFRLVERTDEVTARLLAGRARDAGFDVEVHRLRPLSPLAAIPPGILWGAGSPLAVLAFLFLLRSQLLGPFSGAAPFLFGALAVTVAVGTGGDAVQRRLAARPVAFRRDVAPVSAPPVEVDAPPGVVERALAALAELDAALAAADLPDAARRDLTDSTARLRERAVAVGRRMEALSVSVGASTEDVAPLEQRRARLATLQRAGERVDPAEVARLDAALAAHADALAEQDRAEADAVACRAQLVEIAGAAARVRSRLLEGDRSASEVIGRLEREAEAVERARRELRGRQGT